MVVAAVKAGNLATGHAPMFVDQDMINAKSMPTREPRMPITESHGRIGIAPRRPVSPEKITLRRLVHVPGDNCGTFDFRNPIENEFG